MNIDRETLEKIAHLSRLELTEAELAKYQGDLSKILTWMEKLNELDTTAVEPLIHISSETNVLRADETGPSLPQQDALMPAPKQDGNYFRVPKVIE